jgi:hypothetical protein
VVVEEEEEEGITTGEDVVEGEIMEEQGEVGGDVVKQLHWSVCHLSTLEWRSSITSKREKCQQSWLKNLSIRVSTYTHQSQRV